MDEVRSVSEKIKIVSSDPEVIREARHKHAHMVARALLDAVQGDDANERFGTAFYYLHHAANALSQELTGAENVGDEGAHADPSVILRMIADDYGATNLMRWAREIAIADDDDEGPRRDDRYQPWPDDEE